MTKEEIHDKAVNFAADYKPWQEDLHYSAYAEYGFEMGYRQALADLKKDANDET